MPCARPGKSSTKRRARSGDSFLPVRRTVEGRQRALELLAREAAPDEDEPRAVVLVGPPVEVLRRMDDVLDAVQDERSRAADVQQPLDPEHVAATALKQHGQPDPER